MTPERQKANIEFLDRRTARYPHQQVVQRGGEHDPNPVTYGAQTLVIRKGHFMRVPLDPVVMWAFEHEEDLTMFREWVGL